MSPPSSLAGEQQEQGVMEMNIPRWDVPGRIPCLSLGWFNISSPAQAVRRVQQCHFGAWHSKQESRTFGKEDNSCPKRRGRNLFPAG